jgi:putative ABC transport system permease protein
MPDTLLQDLRYALRALRSSPGFATVAILSLALGIGANTAIFSLIDSVMLKFLPVSHPEQLLQVSIGSEGNWWTNPIWEQVRDRQDVFSGVFAFGTEQFNLANGGEVRYARGNWVTGDFFSTLGVKPLVGRTFTAADDKRGCAAIAILSYEFWQSEYSGDANILDKKIALNTHPVQIVGVIQPGFGGINVGRGVDIYAPLCSEAILIHENSALDKRGNWWLSVVGRPKPGVSEKQVRARLRAIAPEVLKTTLPSDWTADGQRHYLSRNFDVLPAANGLSYIRTQYQPALLALMVVVAVVLLIACANVANLLLSRAAMRQREIAIRMAIGAGRGRLIRQLLTESLLLAFSGAGLGILFAQWGSRLLVHFLSSSTNQVVLDLSIDGRVLGFTIAVAIATGVLFGLAPAWRGTRVEPQSAMKANARGVVESQSRLGLAKILAMVQVALSMVLLTGAGLMLGTFSKLSSADTGFDRNQLLLVRADPRNSNYPLERRPALYLDLQARLAAIPGVRSASFADITPVSGSDSNTVLQVDGYVAKSRQDMVVWTNSISSGFFQTLQTPFIAGRDFNNRDTLHSPPVVIVNESLANKFFGSPFAAMGKTFRQGWPVPSPVEIVGIVRDAKYTSLRAQNEMIEYLPQAQISPPRWNNFQLRASGSALALIPSVKAAFGDVSPDITLQFRTLALQLDESLGREKLLATLSGFFGALALLLSTIGLYGVMSYNVARRRNEIGIRMALGAEQSRVLRMVLGEVATLIFIGLAVGFAATLATTRFVSSFLYNLAPNDPRTLASAAAVLALVAVIAGYLPARRASRLDPMTALREE